MADLKLQMDVGSEHQIQDFLQPLVIRHLSLFEAEEELNDLSFLDAQQCLLVRSLLAVRSFEPEDFFIWFSIKQDILLIFDQLILHFLHFDPQPFILVKLLSRKDFQRLQSSSLLATIIDRYKAITSSLLLLGVLVAFNVFFPAWLPYPRQVLFIRQDVEIVATASLEFNIVLKQDVLILVLNWFYYLFVRGQQVILEFETLFFHVDVIQCSCYVLKKSFVNLLNLICWNTVVIH